MLKDLVKANKVCLGKSEMTNGNDYSVTLEYNGNCITMVYHDNYLNEGDRDDFLYVLLIDSFIYEDFRNAKDLMLEYGCKDIKQAKEIYKVCKRHYKKLHRLFTDEEISQLQAEFEDF